MNELNARVERLERQNKRLVRWGGATLGLVTTCWLMSMMPVCKTVWAERFVLKDSSGNERGILTAYETGGTPRFTLHDKRGTTLATLSVDKNGGAFLALHDKNGRNAFRIGVSESGAPMVNGKPLEPSDAAPDKPKSEGGSVGN